VITTFARHSDVVQDLAWSPDSQRIVSGGNDYTVKIWDAASGEELFTYPTFDFVLTVDWSPTGEYVVAARVSDPIPLILRAWQTTEELIAYAKECCVWRKLTAEERLQFGLP
jgi:WD40 repeat protein